MSYSKAAAGIPVVRQRNMGLWKQPGRRTSKILFWIDLMTVLFGAEEWLFSLRPSYWLFQKRSQEITLSFQRTDSLQGVILSSFTVRVSRSVLQSHTPTKRLLSERMGSGLVFDSASEVKYDNQRCFTLIGAHYCDLSLGLTQGLHHFIFPTCLQ